MTAGGAAAILDLRWLHIPDPDSPVLDQVARERGFHELDVEDCRHHRQMAKVTEYEKYTFVVAKVLLHDGERQRLRFEDFNVFVQPDGIVTVPEGPCDVPDRAWTSTCRPSTGSARRSTGSKTRWSGSPPPRSLRRIPAVANRTNEVMRILTIYGTVAIPLVVITGFYGMNIRIPGEKSLHAFWLVVGLMAVTTTLVLWYFRRKRWW